MRNMAGGDSELGLIEEIRRRFAHGGVGKVSGISRLGLSGGVALGIGDDAAVLRVRVGWEVVVTTDLMLEGRHFRRDLHSAESIGHRCIARGLSDIAAMGAHPMAAFLSLGLPSSTTKDGAKRRWLRQFLDGFQHLADGSGVVLAGGDTGEMVGEGMVADVVLVGQAPRGTVLRRSGAQVGDGIYVTGALGGAAAELERMCAGRGRRTRRRESEGLQPQSYPEPRLGAGRELRRRGLATACIDISDGLSTDLRHICQASGVGAELWAEALPIHRMAAESEGLRLALHGGEDYELLFTVAAGVRVPGRISGVAVTPIGKIVRAKGGPQMELVAGDGRRTELKAGGWEHFGR